MKLYKKLKHLINIYVLHLTVNKNKRIYHGSLSRMIKFNHDTKNIYNWPLHKKYLLSIIKQLRKLYPYVVRDYSKAKKMYTDYFKMNNHIESYDKLCDKILFETDDTYITEFRNKQPIKGDRYADYYIFNKFNNSLNMTFKLKYIVGNDIECSYIGLFGIDDIKMELGSTKNFTNYRYATIEEIEKFKLDEKNMNVINKKIVKAKDKLSKLYEEKKNIK